MHKKKIFDVMITSDLKWTVHGTNIRQALNKMIGVLNCFGNCHNTCTRWYAFNVFIKPNLNYCLPVWCHNNKSIEYAIDHVYITPCRTRHLTVTKLAVQFNYNTYRITGHTVIQIVILIIMHINSSTFTASGWR